MFESFKTIPTQDLYILELGVAEKVEKGSFTYDGNKTRYTIVKKVKEEHYYDEACFKDIFTKTKYTICSLYGHTTGVEYIVGYRPLITPKSRLKKSELEEILETLNPTYIPHKPNIYVFKPNNNTKK